jgi:hypothetical protein
MARNTRGETMLGPGPSKMREDVFRSVSGAISMDASWQNFIYGV